MRKKRVLAAEEEDNEINLTPMLDVVFIMLIFFIVTASFIKEAGIQVERPDAPTAEKQEDAAILIAISANDEIWIDRKEMDPRAVRGMIERLHAENWKPQNRRELSTSPLPLMTVSWTKQCDSGSPRRVRT